MTLGGRVVLLGTGTSHGVPMIGCACAVCRSTDPKDKRLRTAAYLEVPGKARVLIDASVDVRQQLLTNNIMRLDAVLFTHGHADHILGLDDLRSLNTIQGGPIPCYANERAWEAIRRTFYYAFDGVPKPGGGVPQLVPNLIDGPIDIGGLTITPVPLLHGRLPIYGFRVGNFSYLTDCNAIPESSWPLIRGTELLVLDALRDQSHDTHFTVDEALGVIERLAPRRAWLTHMAHDLPHAATNARLPEGVELAYDGLVLDIEIE